MNLKRGTLTGLALLCTAAVMATGAVAEEDRESVEISYVAGSLAQPRAAESLYRQIRAAARKVCHEPDIRELHQYQLFRQCFDQAVETAVATVSSTALTALHHSKSHTNRRRESPRTWS